jgi:hypothetical protein
MIWCDTVSKTTGENTYGTNKKSTAWMQAMLLKWTSKVFGV